ncbi:MAG: phenylalanine--tRNA ligase subunit beta [Candidatus Sumerlaeia bacterium]|nr:phenylalanine--tRNA ligase subunit beta [Candidatus Sumerlaeia bacterium]
MRFSLRLLRKYLDTTASNEALIDAITDAGLEVEETLDLGMLSKKVVVGRIDDIEAIPDAEKIRMTTVDTGGPRPLRIVCGAKNIEVGDKVPVALFGMRFPNGEELKPRKIRGLESEGMLCSAVELGVSDDAAGIWILPQDAPVGEPWDVLVTIKVTPNRPDALSLVGLARDLAAKSGGKLRVPAPVLEESAVRTEAKVKVTVEAKADCPRYTARLVEDVAVGHSPRWMQVALESAGMRPINNVVDVTNFVLHELGHPLHGFDCEQLAQRHIVVRLAKPGERITTLDGKEAQLATTDLLICDAEKPVALAGVMGGGNSEVGPSTRNVLIESAYFRPSTIRRTAKRLEKSTEASYRFERGTDARRLTLALNRAAQLLAELAGGKVAKGIVDVVGDVPEQPRLTLRLARVAQCLGLELSGREVADILRSLDYEITRGDKDELSVVVPTHRVDVSVEEDLIEDLARIIGYDRIPERLPALAPKTRTSRPVPALRRALRDAFETLGFCEALNFSFGTEAANATVGLADGLQVRVRNPLTADQAVMRRSLVPSLLQNLSHNLNHGVGDVRLFEIAETFAWASAEPRTDLPKDTLEPATDERVSCVALLCGGGRASWRSGPAEYDFFDAKGAAEAILARLGIARLVVERAADVPWLHPGRAARFLVKGQPVLLFGELHPALAKELDLKKRAYLMEIAVTAELAALCTAPAFTEIPRFPAAQRDLALLVDRAVPALELERTIRKAGKELLQSVTLFDMYEGKQVAEGKRSLAFSLVFRAPDRTLQDAEVASAMEAVRSLLEEKHGAALR